MEAKQARILAEQIASGHAYDKDVVGEKEFPEIGNREEFAKLIFQVLTDPASLEKALREGRQAFWSDRRDVLVILDLLSEDGRTALRPNRGSAIFEG